MHEHVRAILIELEAIVGPGWSIATERDVIVLVGPDSSGFVSEVWRIARFVAYDDYVCIERRPNAGKSYALVSRSRSGLEFSMVLSAEGSGSPRATGAAD
jgi:hypothetical protein